MAYARLRETAIFELWDFHHFGGATEGSEAKVVKIGYSVVGAGKEA